MHFAGLARTLTAGLFLALAGCGTQRPAAERVYRIGTDNAFPYHYLKPDGSAEGLTADLIQEAARRTGIRLHWQLHPEGPSAALKAGRVDLWSLLAVQPSLWPELHFSRPYLTNSFVVIAAKSAITNPDGLKSIRRLSVVSLPFVSKLARETLPWAALVSFPTRQQAFESVCQGETDAIFVEARSAHGFVLRRPAGCDGVVFSAVGAPAAQQKLGIAATREAAVVADRLRDEIDRMLDDGTTARLLSRWSYFYSGEAENLFRHEQARAAQRRSMLMVALLGICCTLLFVLAVRFRAAQRAAQSANRVKSHFVASMSHEMRTPLHGILGVSRILSSTKLDVEQREHVEMIESSGRTLLALVNDVLDVAQLERGSISLVEEVVALPDLIRETLRTFEIHASGKGVLLESQGVEALPPHLRADGGRLRQVLTNLLGNAVKFTAKGKISFTAGCYESGGRKWLRMLVEDTGIGMTPDQLKHIFEKFYQADGQRFPGTGLGLSITKSLVEAMGGEIEVSSKPGVGSTFQVRIPMKIAESPQIEPAPGDKPAPHAFAARILVVEDNIVNQRIVQKLLEREGYRVSTAADGEAALRLYAPGMFHAVLMDCQLPGIDGYEATRQIRLRDDGMGRTPVIALTAAAMSGERERCMDAGMDDYLTKPVQADELHEKLRHWISRRLPDSEPGPQPAGT